MRLVSIIVALFLLVLGYGCERYVPVSSPQEDPPEELSIPDFTNIDPGNSQLTLVWEVRSEENISYYRVYHAVTASGTFLAQDSTTGMSITIAGLNASETHRFAVAPVSKRGIEGYWSRIVTLVPAKLPAGRLEIAH